MILCIKKRKPEYQVAYKNQVIMWLARNKDERLFLFVIKPHKEEDMGEWNDRDYYEKVELSNDLFHSVKWEDDEPTEVVLTLKNRV